MKLLTKFFSFHQLLLLLVKEKYLMVLGSDGLAGKGYQLISDCDYVLVQRFYKSDP